MDGALVPRSGRGINPGSLLTSHTLRHVTQVPPRVRQAHKDAGCCAPARCHDHGSKKRRRSAPGKKKRTAVLLALVDEGDESPATGCSWSHSRCEREFCWVRNASVTSFKDRKSRVRREREFYRLQWSAGFCGVGVVNFIFIGLALRRRCMAPEWPVKNLH